MLYEADTTPGQKARGESSASSSWGRGLPPATEPSVTGLAPSLAFPWLFPLGTVTFLALTVLPKRANQGAS